MTTNPVHTIYWNVIS